MSEYKGVNKTLVDAGGVSTIEAGLRDGRVKVEYDYRVLLGTEASGSTLTMGGPLPIGAKVLAIILWTATAQTSLTVSIGDETSATRFASAVTSLQTAGTYIFGGDQTAITSTTKQITLTTGSATVTAGTLYCAILYVTD